MSQQPIQDGLLELAELAGPHRVDVSALGTRIRRRRRTRLTLATATAAALLATAGWLLPSALGGDGSGAPVGPAGGSTVVGPAKGGSNAGTSATLDPEAQQVVDLLKRVLPPGKITVLGGRGLHDKGLASPLGSGQFEPSASVEYDDGHGAALVTVDLSRWTDPDTSKSPFTCAVGDGMPKPNQCGTTRLPGGAVFNMSRIDALKGAWNAEWTATYAAPDGARVVIQEDNAPYGKGAAATRAQPPFDAAQLQRMVTSPLWSHELAAIPAVGGQSRTTNTPFGPDGIGAIFYRLIPSGFTISGCKGADDPMMGNTMVLTDAQGKGSVFNMDMSGGPDTPAGLSAFRKDYPNAVQLPSGDWLGTKQVPGQGGQGTVQYWVAVQHGNSRVVVVALNSVGLKGPRTRPTPVLTIDQLAAIAESPNWSAGM